MNRHSSFPGMVLEIDLMTREIHKKELEQDFARKYIGGRGFTSRLQYDLIPVGIDSLGPENVLIVAPGALSGALAPSAARIVFGGRSPLTGILGDANSGGFFGAVLKNAGYSLIIIRGKAPHPVYIRINEDLVDICDARHLWGKDVYQTTNVIQRDNGKDFRIAAIGQAGENLVHIAGIMLDKEHGAARTGLGAVMGSKNLKAMAVRSSKPFQPYDPVAFKKLADELRSIERSDKRAQDFSVRGTLGTLIDHHTAIGALNTCNYQYGQFEGKEKIDNEALEKTYLVRRTGCYQCTLRADKYCLVEDGEYAGAEVGGPEYSTTAAFGSGVGNDNLAAIIKANELANRYGLDTLDLGGVIAFSMELYQRGLLTEKETDGLDLTWGNHRAMIELIERIAFRRGAFADLLANGVHVAAEEIGRGAERYAVHVKGMTPAPLDARPVKVYNFRYAVGPRGADHLRISAPGGYALDSLPTLEAAEKLRYWQSIVAIPDLMGLCKFAYVYYTETVEKTLHKTLGIVPTLYNSTTGLDLTVEELTTASERVTNVERAHNCRLGLTSKDDILPPRFTEDPMPEGPAKGKVYDILDEMKEAWYTVQGWDTTTGIPTRNRLVQLGLSDIADDLQAHGVDVSVSSE